MRLAGLSHYIHDCQGCQNDVVEDDDYYYNYNIHFEPNINEISTTKLIIITVLFIVVGLVLVAH